MPPVTSPVPDLDVAACHRAVNARDRRFDGLFFVAIRTTRIYCRPVCPSRIASPEHRRFYASQGEAERDGYRPCLRCRPELAPGRAAIDAVGRLARIAARRIAAGALDGASVATLAQDLGASERHLRRALDRELGLSPVALAQTHRLLLARQLLADTALPVTQVAYASGFQSLRRFNALVRERYRLTPSELRSRSRKRREGAPDDDLSIVLSLEYRPPYDWQAMLSHLAAWVIPGVEAVTLDSGGTYRRAVSLRGRLGHILMRPAPARDLVLVEVSATLVPVLAPLLARVRRLLDLDAEPRSVSTHLGADAALAPFVAQRPGLRVPGALDGFELALRTLLAEHVSARDATTLVGRLMRHVAAPLDDPRFPDLTHAPPTAESLSDAGVHAIVAAGLTRTLAEYVVALARAVAGGEFPELTADTPGADPRGFHERFVRLPGATERAAEYVAMRALAWPDAFPHGDPGLQQAAGVESAMRLRATSERWRPWRAYAAQHLWTGLAAHV